MLQAGDLLELGIDCCLINTFDFFATRVRFVAATSVICDLYGIAVKNSSIFEQAD